MSEILDENSQGDSHSDLISILDAEGKYQVYTKGEHSHSFKPVAKAPVASRRPLKINGINKNKYLVPEGCRLIATVNTFDEVEDIRKRQKVYCAQKTFNGEKQRYQCPSWKTECKYAFYCIQDDDHKYLLYEKGEHNHEVDTTSTASNIRSSKTSTPPTKKAKRKLEEFFNCTASEAENGPSKKQTSSQNKQMDTPEKGKQTSEEIVMSNCDQENPTTTIATETGPPTPSQPDTQTSQDVIINDGSSETTPSTSITKCIEDCRLWRFIGSIDSVHKWYSLKGFAQLSRTGAVTGANKNRAKFKCSKFPSTCNYQIQKVEYEPGKYDLYERHAKTKAYECVHSSNPFLQKISNRLNTSEKAHTEAYENFKFMVVLYSPDLLTKFLQHQKLIMRDSNTKDRDHWHCTANSAGCKYRVFTIENKQGEFWVYRNGEHNHPDPSERLAHSSVIEPLLLVAHMSTEVGSLKPTNNYYAARVRHPSTNSALVIPERQNTTTEKTSQLNRSEKAFEPCSTIPTTCSTPELPNMLNEKGYKPPKMWHFLGSILSASEFDKFCHNWHLRADKKSKNHPDSTFKYFVCSRECIGYRLLRVEYDQNKFDLFERQMGIHPNLCYPYDKAIQPKNLLMDLPERPHSSPYKDYQFMTELDSPEMLDKFRQNQQILKKIIYSQSQKEFKILVLEYPQGRYLIYRRGQHNHNIPQRLPFDSIFPRWEEFNDRFAGPITVHPLKYPDKQPSQSVILRRSHRLPKQRFPVEAFLLNEKENVEINHDANIKRYFSALNTKKKHSVDTVQKCRTLQNVNPHNTSRTFNMKENPISKVSIEPIDAGATALKIDHSGRNLLDQLSYFVDPKRAEAAEPSDVKPFLNCVDAKEEELSDCSSTTFDSFDSLNDLESSTMSSKSLEDEPDQTDAKVIDPKPLLVYQPQSQSLSIDVKPFLGKKEPVDREEDEDSFKE
uniref:Uncharacterized protein n=1 Tax=Ditylenchus dipsaci TaxID=166011 RepID=A0A915E6C1_9BILA